MDKTLDTIDRLRPDVVLMSNSYGVMTSDETGQQLSANKLQDALRGIIG